MNRETIRTVVLKNLADAVEGLDPATIDSSKSMKELGANSLDIVEVVSCSMRELRIKVPRSELADLKNIDQLVDRLFERASDRKAS
ncbi:MAG: acyl carrier protein [Sandaracinaceae bacterium]|nr:acyl carrier protein [Sandaracinaceae bacterium]